MCPSTAHLPRPTAPSPTPVVPKEEEEEEETIPEEEEEEEEPPLPTYLGLQLPTPPFCHCI